MRSLVIRIVSVLVLLALGAVMMVVGRGHTAYFDNKNLNLEGTSYEAVRRINVTVGGEQAAKLSKKERGMATFLGQKLSFGLEVIREKGGESEFLDYTISVPYGMDGVVINLPALIAGAGQDVWMTEFVPIPTVEEEDAEPDGDDLDEFDFGGDI